MEIHTHRGHRVHVLDGNAQGIIQRGNEIESLGHQMENASGVLGRIAGGATEEKGRSIEKIRSEVGDAHEELLRASERYKPTGKAMADYGHSLDAVQLAMRSLVDEIEQTKARADAAHEAARHASTVAASSAADADTDATARARADADSWMARDAAHTADVTDAALDDLLSSYDAQWDTWDEAYDKALRGITDATKGNVTDDWTDNLAGVVDIVLKVLTWVGVALAIAALVIGGPIIAAIAAVVAVITLLGTLYLYAKGRRSLQDVGWAVLGVLPFGKLAKLGPLLKSGSKAKALTGLLKIPIDEIATPIKRIRDLRGLTRGGGEIFRSGMSRRAAAGLANRIRSGFSNFGGAGLSKIGTRILGGSSRAYVEEFAKAFSKLPPHHQRIVLKNLGSLGDVLSSGGKALTRTEQIANVLDFAVKRGRMVFLRTNDIASWGDPKPVDTWRTQLGG